MSTLKNQSQRTCQPYVSRPLTLQITLQIHGMECMLCDHDFGWSCIATFLHAVQEYYRLSNILNSHTKPFYCWHRRLYIMEEISNYLTEFSNVTDVPLEMYAYENNSGTKLDLTWQVLIEQELAFLRAVEQKKPFNLSFGQYCQMLMVHCYTRQDCIPIMALWEDFYLTLVYRCHPNRHYWTCLERVLRILHGTKAATVIEEHRKRIQEMFEL
ncbi:hypothetical protein GNI_155670 [Gregarina niphandrodes]|uniref:Uncharacterized protein n=1 Tax=Gregarina niphandrodes TaxID=110365 RepID=A0A023AZ47_GRENI|nr:hypothetical protein GNI_155670 [Gregarina niphandrodes]EZG43925.1 hypothetical protein GNI_155670 [Gregarina niphandrodes]|eukprot:XP_011132896.1 hypothetical protein GNI_155670 [Gregarina niphandrodes]